jgi:hypothetical protein
MPPQQPQRRLQLLRVKLPLMPWELKVLAARVA